MPEDQKSNSAPPPMVKGYVKNTPAARSHKKVRVVAVPQSPPAQPQPPEGATDKAPPPASNAVSPSGEQAPRQEGRLQNIYEINPNIRQSPREAALSSGSALARSKGTAETPPPRRTENRGPAARSPQQVGPTRTDRPATEVNRFGRGKVAPKSLPSRPLSKGLEGRPSLAPPASFGPASRSEAAKKFRQKKEAERVKEKEKEKDREEEENFNKLLNYRKHQTRKTNPVPKTIEILEAVTVNDLAKKMNLKAGEIIGRLMQMGLMVTVNQQIDHETAAILASEYGTEVKVVSLYEETIIKSDEDKPERMRPRPPVVTVMGHVDHGKTKLLDAIRQSDVASSEHGGITQHIGAYQVQHPKGPITFLDTPGHEAFSMMRARGAQVTDIVVLVVAANDGVMPQTIEAIRHAQDAKVPIIVAINKIDLPDANPEKVKKQLSEYDLTPEEWGGNTLYVQISALKKIGLEDLIEAIHLQAEMLDLKADPERRAEGRVLESRIDQGRGTVSTVLVQKGTLRIGDPFVGGIWPGKVRAMFNDKGQPVQEAGPSTPVEVMGVEGIPDAGDPFQVTCSEKEAREYAEKRQELKRQETSKNVKKITLSNLYDKIQEESLLELKVIIKADTHGSVEALKGALTKLSTPEIRLNVIHAAAGPIVKEDVYLASASGAIIIGFHVRPSTDAQAAADQEKVEIRKYNIIYDAVEDIRKAMEGMLSPELREEQTGTIEVRQVFKVPKVGFVAGCYVTQGKVKRSSLIHVIRDGVQIYSGKLASLKRFKDDVREVAEGYECGLSIENFQDYQVGDILEAYDVVKVAKKLEATG